MLSLPLSSTISLKSILKERTERSPAKICCYLGGRSWTWQELERASLGVAEQLRVQGLEAGTRVAICARAGFGSLAVQFGAAMAGVILGHIPINSKPPELQYMLTKLQPRLLWLEQPEQPIFEGVLASLKLKIEMLLLDDLLLDDLLLGERLRADDFRVESPVVTTESPMQVLFTSGTSSASGQPKGVVISQRAKLSHAFMHVENLQLNDSHIIWCALPLHHQFGQWLIWAAVLSGAALFFRTRFNAFQCWEDLAQQGITHLPAVPTMLFKLLSCLPEKVPALALEYIVYGAAPTQTDIVLQLRRLLPGVKWFQGFGQTEAGFCLGLDEDGHQSHPNSLGRASPYCQLQLTDDLNHPVSQGQPGQLTMRTPCMMDGYLNDPSTSFFSVDSDGNRYGRSDDILRQDPDGFYFYLGRLGDMLISGGVNIHPAELEQALTEHAAIRDAAIIGMPDPRWGESITAVLVADDSQVKPDDEALKVHCQARLAAWKHPKRFIWIKKENALPRTSNGKLQRQLIKQNLLQKHLSQQHPNQFNQASQKQRK